MWCADLKFVRGIRVLPLFACLLTLVGDGVPSRGREVELPFDDDIEELVVVLAVEWRETAEPIIECGWGVSEEGSGREVYLECSHDVEDDANTPVVDCFVITIAMDNLWRNVAWCTAHRRHILVANETRQTEVRDFNHRTRVL